MLQQFHFQYKKSNNSSKDHLIFYYKNLRRKSILLSKLSYIYVCMYVYASSMIVVDLRICSCGTK